MSTLALQKVSNGRYSDTICSFSYDPKKITFEDQPFVAAHKACPNHQHLFIGQEVFHRNHIYVTFPEKNEFSSTMHAKILFLYQDTSKYGFDFQLNCAFSYEKFQESVKKLKSASSEQIVDDQALAATLLSKVVEKVAETILPHVFTNQLNEIQQQVPFDLDFDLKPVVHSYLQLSSIETRDGLTSLHRGFEAIWAHTLLFPTKADPTIEKEVETLIGPLKTGRLESWSSSSKTQVQIEDQFSPIHWIPGLSPQPSKDLQIERKKEKIEPEQNDFSKFLAEERLEEEAQKNRSYLGQAWDAILQFKKLLGDLYLNASA
ncbi:MAG: hypothetical protein V4487_04780 [Chlamydiota bacterium]